MSAPKLDVVRRWRAGFRQRCVTSDAWLQNAADAPCFFPPRAWLNRRNARVCCARCRPRRPWLSMRSSGFILGICRCCDEPCQDTKARRPAGRLLPRTMLLGHRDTPFHWAGTLAACVSAAPLSWACAWVLLWAAFVSLSTSSERAVPPTNTQSDTDSNYALIAVDDDHIRLKSGSASRPGRRPSFNRRAAQHRCRWYPRHGTALDAPVALHPRGFARQAEPMAVASQRATGARRDPELLTNRTLQCSHSSRRLSHANFKLS